MVSQILPQPALLNTSFEITKMTVTKKSLSVSLRTGRERGKGREVGVAASLEQLLVVGRGVLDGGQDSRGRQGDMRETDDPSPRPARRYTNGAPPDTVRVTGRRHGKVLRGTWRH